MVYDIKINDVNWKIIDLTYAEVNELYMQNPSDYDGAVNGFTDSFNNVIYLTSDLQEIKMKKLLYHELTHAFIGEFVTCDMEKMYSEEDIAEFNGYYGLKIAGIVMDYSEYRSGNNTDYSILLIS